MDELILQIEELEERITPGLLTALASPGIDAAEGGEGAPSGICTAFDSPGIQGGEGPGAPGMC